MRISITQTRQISASGFTLFELLICILIVGSLLALGAAFFQPRISALENAVSRISALISHTRVDAMLSKQRKMLEFDGAQINQINSNGQRQQLDQLPDHTTAFLNGKSLMQNSAVRLSFGPLGYAGENLIHLQAEDESWSIYLPPLGGPVSRKGIFSIEEMRKDKP